MGVENVLQEYNQVATLAGILAGFAFSAVIQLLSVDRPGRLMTIVLIIFSTSSLMFLFTLFAFVLNASAIAEIGKEVEELAGWSAFAFVIALLGLNLFLLGVGLTGWLRSRVTGIITTIAALITFCLVNWLFIAIIGVFINQT
ncbi:MAG: hypothetical protein N2117_14680 [Anaerolineales bacterium]|nr:hypothetical protein [Anaerolineales bacterium]MCX7756470.1 hypothetical protein [Anaerolineales bacterium]MDW8278343.1 hypothetical protein [Anaerolineales bacterium]